jgi:two-component system KDP operon response regulator KdpE
MSRILAVDDEPQMRRALVANLTARGYEVDVAPDGEAAIRAASEHPPDLVILDLGLPGISGLEVIDALRSWSRVPILVLSARDADPDKIAALDAGADDYVTKPFSIGELMARVRAALRRSVPTDGQQPVVTTPDFTVDFSARTALAGARAVHLTPIEWRIVENLMRNPGRLVSQRQLLQAVWGPTYSDETHYLRVHMTHVRRKLEPDPTRPRYFVTEAGMGYRYEPPPGDDT